MPNYAISQLNVSFFATDTLCLLQDVELDNTSINADHYIWDFCFDALSNEKGAVDISVISESVAPEGIEFVYDAGNWYGFVTSRENNRIYRLDFGNSIYNSPEIIDLGDLNGLSSKPKDIKLKKESDNWYAILINYGSSNIIRFSFGNKLNNLPTAINIGNLSNWNTLRGMDLVEVNDSLILIVSSSNNNKLTLVNFGNSITNNPTAQDILDIGIGNTLINRPMGVSLAKDGDNWHGLLTSYSANKVIMMDFGTNLFSAPTFIDAGALNLPTDCVLKQDGNKFYGIVQTRNSGLFRMNFGNSLNAIPALEAMPNASGLSNVFNISLVRTSPNWSLFTIGASDKTIKRIDFEDVCGWISLNSSTEFEPQNISYNALGPYPIELTASSANGNFDIYLDTVVVRNASSPIISFTTTNACIANENTFAAISTDDPSITSWNWDFGDGIGFSVQQNPSYQYVNPGTYDVSLAIEAVNGCSNSVNKTVHIYDPPSAGYTYPITTICSNSGITFTNQTTFSGPNSLLSYEWNMDSETILEEVDPVYTFTSGGDKNVSLTASIPGCSSEVSKVISVTPGPLTNFTFDGICSYDEFSFANTTTGDDITSYHWDFGDGYYSSNISPNHDYESGGNYIVSLTASNSLGCNSTLKQVVPVRYIPEMRFTNDLACSNNNVSFFDESTSVEANITERYWTLTNDEFNYQKTSSGPSPSFLLDETGTYDITLVAQTNYGCLDTLTRTIDVYQSPLADFAIENTCFGDSVFFKPEVELAENTSLIGVDWLIDGILYSQEEVKHKFLQPGEYDSELYVRASNLCTDNISKSITIHPLPQISINFSSNCEDQLVEIGASLQSPDDPVLSYDWFIDDDLVAKQDQFQYTFNKDKDYDIMLKVLTANNCLNTKNTSLTIYPSPTSKFDVVPSMGASPLNTQFTDRSQGAQQVYYQFSQYNNDESTNKNPSYTYTEIGGDIATQIVENEFGCKDSSMQEIEVLFPRYDISVTNFDLIESSGELKFVVSLKNNGTILINHPILQIKLGDKIKLNHELETTLYPGEENEFLIDFNVVKSSNDPLSFVCLSVDEKFGNFLDENGYDNTQCINIDSDFLVLEPYPNPSKTFVEVPIVLPESGTCDISMVGENGTLVYTKTFNGMSSGLNYIKMDLTPYRTGYYMLMIKHQDLNTTKKIVIQ